MKNPTADQEGKTEEPAQLTAGHLPYEKDSQFGERNDDDKTAKNGFEGIFGNDFPAEYADGRSGGGQRKDI